MRSSFQRRVYRGRGSDRERRQLAPERRVPARGGIAITDAELVDRALAGSQDAFRELVERYERPVFSLLVRMLRDPALAEDLAQDVFVKAFRRLAQYDRGRQLSSWLFKIAHNTGVDHLRRREVETVSLAPPEGEDGDHRAMLADPDAESPAAAAERADLARALERAIARLRVEYRELVTLRYQEGLSYQEIVEVTGQPLGTVKTHLHRARKELAGILSALGWGPSSKAPAGDETFPRKGA